MLTRVRRSAVALVASGALVLMGGMVAAPQSALAATCGQSTHVWFATPGGSLGGGNTVTLSPGSPAWATGVVAPNTNIFYWTTDGFFFVNGQNETAFTTTSSDGNCVVHHENNEIFIPAQSGPIDVYASYEQWETGTWVTSYVGEIVIG